MKSKIIALAAAATFAFGGGGMVLFADTAQAAPAASVTEKQATSYPVLKQGSTGAPVAVLQRMLNANGADLEVDGEFGPVTTAAVKAYQGKQGLEQDATVGPTTWSALLPVLTTGAEGAAVKALQDTINERGWNLEVDGRFGPVTAKAVAEYQTSKGLVADSSVGPKTWGALLGSSDGDGGDDGDVKPVPGEWVVMDQMTTGPMGGVSCGPTSVAMVLVAMGKEIPGYRGPDDYADAVANLRTVAGTGNDGTGRDGMIAALTTYGAQDQTTQDEAEALAAVRAGKPVILHGWTTNLPWWNGGYGHYIVVNGYDEASGQYSVIDPAGGRTETASAQVLTDFGNSVGAADGGAWRTHHIVS